MTVPSWQIWLALGLLYVVWGSTYLAIRYAVETFPPFLMASVRYLVAGGLMYVWLRLRRVPTPKKIHWRSAFIIGALLLGGGNGGVVWAEKVVPSGLTALLVSVVPLWIAFFDWLRPGGKRPTFLAVIGLVLGFVGLVVLIGPNKIFVKEALSPSILALIFAPMAWGIGSVYSRQAPLPESAFMATAIEMLAGGLLLLTMGVVFGETRGFSLSQVSASSWWSIVYLIFLGAIVGFTAYIWLLKNASLTLTATYAYVNPVVAVILGWLIASEALTLQTMAGGAIILVSVALTTVSSRSE